MAIFLSFNALSATASFWLIAACLLLLVGELAEPCWPNHIRIDFVRAMTVRPAWFLGASAFRHFDKLSDRKLGDRFSAVAEPVEASFWSLSSLRQAQ